MAKGRLIQNRITLDKKVSELSDDTSRLAFTWLITYADCEGRTYGDPGIVRSMLFPRRDDIDNTKMAAYIQEWHDAGLVVWYEADDDKYIFFPKFEDNQYIDKSREAASTIPEPPAEHVDTKSRVTPELVPSNSRVTREQIKLKEKKLIEKNGIENKTIETTDDVVTGINYPYIWDKIKSQLRADMPVSGFGMVKDTVVHDVQNKTIRIRAPTPSAVEWLNDRILKTANNILKGYMSNDFSIEFIEFISEGEDEHT